MANNVTGPVWNLDTAGVVTTKPVTILGFVYKPAANSNHIVVKDNSGNIIIDWLASNSIAANPQIGLTLPQAKTFQGLNVDTIDGGNLFVYLA